MPRIRTIKPEFWSSPGVAKMSPLARLTFIGMWNWADDAGRGTYNPRELMGFIFPNDYEMTVAEFAQLCAEIERHVAVIFYKVADRGFYYIPSWKRHQSKYAKMQASKFPAPDDGVRINPVNMQVIDGVAESSGNSATMRGNSGDSSGDSAIGTGEQGNRGTGEQISLGQTSGSTEREPSERVKPRRPKDPPEFTEFWDAYPRKVGKDRARKAFKSACRRAELSDILAGARRFAAEKKNQDMQYIPHPATWLNDGRWDDQPEPSCAPSRQVPQRKTVTEQAEEVARQLGLTPEMPGQDSQIIDADIIDQKELGA